MSDTTNDPQDYWQICFDGGTDGPTGGGAPQSDDVRLDIVGHSTVTWYRGTGTGWTPMTASPDSQFQWKDSISGSPTSSTPHWILELIINKQNVGIGPRFGARIAVYDASNSAAGVLAWPPTSRDVPDAWGDFPYSAEAAPTSSPSPTVTPTPTPTPSPQPETSTSNDIYVIATIVIIIIAVAGAVAFLKLRK